MDCLSQLAGECQVCPFVSKCDRKRMEALGYFSEPVAPFINTTIDDRFTMTMEDAIKAINDFAKFAYEHKMGL